MAAAAADNTSSPKKQAKTIRSPEKTIVHLLVVNKKNPLHRQDEGGFVVPPGFV
jgi:hypothetical protein